MIKTSRRQLARFVAAELASGRVHMDRLAHRVAAFLITTKQLGQVDLLLRDVADVLNREYDMVHVDITSAQKLSAAMREQIKRYAKNVSGTSNVELSESIDPSLIGGAVVSLPGQELDSSIKSKLKKLMNV
ncbi:MAG TPA: F0F1 ATP synthase subunit delta [Candidatus Saccharimonadales bacterium]|jgi:F-type H+-transporting ATPase subunit delta|nr:F0F1 ATP synthase subunit delta [Candidatus Saccharimonadales bacterium]